VRATVLGRADHSCDSQVDAGAIGCHAGIETAVAPSDLDARFEQAARHCESVEASGCHAGTEGGEGGDARAIILESWSGRHAGVGVQVLVPGRPEVGEGDNAGAWVLESVTQVACNQSVTLAACEQSAPQAAGTKSVTQAARRHGQGVPTWCA
jgi:hypothetical protein